MVAPSLTVNVMVVVPLTPGMGVIVTVRSVPPPPTTTFALGTRLVLLELWFTTSDPTGVSASPMVKGTAKLLVYWLIF